jgi:mRNA interferase RelE/StbE
LLSNYRIFETEEFIKRVRKLESKDASFIQKKANSYVYPQLRKEPHFGNNIKKLRGYEPATWRYRIGKFRIFYAVDENEGIIYILTIDYREDAY